jgi:hypothetical protein
MFKWISAVLFGLFITAGLAPPTGAQTRPLWSSSDFSLTGQLVANRLTVTHRNRTDQWVEFRCRLTTRPTSGGTRIRTTSGDLRPGETWSTRFRKQARLPKATYCDVTADTSDTVLWRSDDYVVLGHDFTQADGSPQTSLRFYNKTADQIHMTCTWWWGTSSSPEVTPQTWSPDLEPYESSSFGAGGVPISSLQRFTCARYEAGRPHANSDTDWSADALR